jgi:hypothetical protein
MLAIFYRLTKHTGQGLHPNPLCTLSQGLAEGARD